MKARVPAGYGNSRADMMKRIQEMQEQMEAKQEELKNKEYTGTAGGGMVSAVVRCDHNVVRIDIKPEVCDPEDTEMLGDLCAAAVNEAIRQAVEENDTVMSGFTDGLNLGGLGGLL